MKKILCYGDSNTYGYDAASPFGECLPFKVTWIGRFFDDPVFKDYLFINQGQNGRCIPRKDWEFQDLEDACAARADIVLGTVMLGSNDLCMDPRISMEDMAAAMEALICRMLTFPCFREDPRKLLLIAPTPTELGRYGSLGEKCDKKSLEFAPRYREVAARTGVSFADAGSWGISLMPDGVHFTPDGHAAFARGLREKLLELLPA